MEQEKELDLLENRKYPPIRHLSLHVTVIARCDWGLQKIENGLSDMPGKPCPHIRVGFKTESCKDTRACRPDLVVFIDPREICSG